MVGGQQEAIRVPGSSCGARGGFLPDPHKGDRSQEPPTPSLTISYSTVSVHRSLFYHQKSPDTPGSPEGNTEGPGTASSEPLLPS